MGRQEEEGEEKMGEQMGFWRRGWLEGKRLVEKAEEERNRWRMWEGGGKGDRKDCVEE